MAYSNRIAEMLALASETEKAEFAHFLADNLEPGIAQDSARVREFVAAFDRFAAPREGERF